MSFFFSSRRRLTCFSLVTGVQSCALPILPHNLDLHSSIVQTRDYPRNDAGKRMSIRWAVTDSTIALMLARFINASILIMAATVFHKAGHTDVQEIEQAYALLSPMLGVGIASTLFAVALLASGLNSTVTATLAGQIVMEGFLHLRMPTWARRLVTRGIAIVPVVIITGRSEEHTSELQSLMRISYAVFCLKKKQINQNRK